MNPPFEGFRKRKLMEVNARYDAVLAQGFPTMPFDEEPEPESLQCRNELDRTNWLGLVVRCQAAVAVGAGGLPGPEIRCTSNRMYRITYQDGLDRMFALLTQVQAAQANWWRLKDLVRACPTRKALDDINLDEGWP